MEVKIVNNSSYELPQYQTVGSAGMDIRANIGGRMVIEPFQMVKVPTGLFLEIPYGYECQIRSRSGLTLKQGLVVANGIGTIDSDYRGEVFVQLYNISNKTQTIDAGERIAQMIVSNYERVEWLQVEQLSQTKRGTGGFGSTGV